MQLAQLMTGRNVLIGVLFVVVAALTFYGTSGLKESFWTISSPAPYMADPTGAGKSELAGMLLNDNAANLAQCSKGSSYSSSGGCIVLTEDQKRMINTRGGNRTCESCDNSF